MRSTPEPTDTGLTLGAPVRQPKAAPAPAPTGTPGVMRGADGRVFTEAPLPPVVTVSQGPFWPLNFPIRMTPAIAARIERARRDIEVAKLMKEQQ